MSVSRQFVRRLTSSAPRMYTPPTSTTTRPASNFSSPSSQSSSSSPSSAGQSPSSVAPPPPGPILRHAPPPIPASLPFHRLRLDMLNSSNGERVLEGPAAFRVSPEAEAALRKPLPESDIEVKPDGIMYLPEIKYRRILCDAFGPAGWGLAARSDVLVGDKVVAREYVLMADGKVISQALGENPYFGPDQLPTAVEGCKSNALMRCCKDLGIASELWDPNFIRRFRKSNMLKLWVVHSVTKRKKMIWMKRGTEDEIPYPFEKSS